MEELELMKADDVVESNVTETEVITSGVQTHDFGSLGVMVGFATCGSVAILYKLYKKTGPILKKKMRDRQIRKLEELGYQVTSPDVESISVEVLEEESEKN